MKKILLIEKDKLARITCEDALPNYKDYTIIDAEGGYIMPGLIDIHSDVIETSIVPRKGLVFDYTLVLTELDSKRLISG